MPIIFFMALMGIIALGIYSDGTTRMEDFQEDAPSVAASMALYHAQAVRACTPPATCPAGAVLPTAQTGSNASMGALSKHFSSASDGTIVVTTLSPLWVQGIAAQPGLISAALASATLGSVGAGPYDPVSMTVTPVNMLYTQRAASGTVTVIAGTAPPPTIVPANVGGLVMRAGYPVIVTPIL